VSSARRVRAGVLIEALRRKSADLARVTAHPVVLSGFPLSLAFLIPRRALSSDLRALPGDSAVRHEQPSPRPSRAWIMPEGVAPPESLAVSRLADRLAVGSGSLRFPCPSTTSLARAPYAADRPGLPRFRPRGFSPPRRFPGSARACGFVAPRCRPWALFSLQSVPLAFRSRTPRRGRWLPCRSSRSFPGAASAVLSPSTFTDSGDVRASSLAGSCRWLEAPFQPRSSHSLAAARLARPPGHPGPRPPDSPRSGRSVDFEAFFPARVRSHHAAVTRRAEAGALLGVLAPPEPCSRQAWGPRSPATAGGVPPPAGSARLSARRATPGISVPSGTSRGLRHERSAAGDPRCRVGSNGDDRIVPLDPSADTGSVRPGPCCPSAAASTPMTFDETMRMRTAHVLEPRL